MPVTVIEVAFLVGGMVIAVLAVLRRRAPPRPVVGGRFSISEALLTAAALLSALISPALLAVALWPGMPDVPLLARWALLPSLVLVFVVAAAAYHLRLQRLANRVTTGLWIGAVATAFLDAVRIAGFERELLPRNMPRVFGVILLDTVPAPPTLLSDLLGCLFQYWLGACLGLSYTLVAGRSRWWLGIVWSVILGVGLIAAPPMIVAMDVGHYARQWGLATGLLAYVAFGVVLGLLGERYVRHSGSVVDLVLQGRAGRRSEVFSSAAGRPQRS